MRCLFALPALALVAASPGNRLDIQIDKVRNGRGVIHVCATRDSSFFPDCSKDPAALKQTVPANTKTARFSNFAPGRYAITLFHDENTNRKLDTFLGIPREGFGFSRNPMVRFGAPSFRQVDMQLTSGFTRASIRMQYLL